MAENGYGNGKLGVDPDEVDAEVEDEKEKQTVGMLELVSVEYDCIPHSNSCGNLILRVHLCIYCRLNLLLMIH